jgi:hypothetical protein
MLDGDDSIVLVHYLAGNAAARLRHPGAVPLTAANLAMQPRNMEVHCSMKHRKLPLGAQLPAQPPCFSLQPCCRIA